MAREITVQQLAEKLAAGDAVYLLDVRHAWEHDLAALPGSTLVPLPELPERIDEVQPPEGALVVVYCHHGIRSRSGAAILEHFGFAAPLSLAGGIDAWSRTIDGRLPRY